MFGFTKTEIGSTKYPVPTEERVDFTSDDVLQLGKLVSYGRAGCTFWVRLRDGRELYVRADKQEKGDEKFLRKLAKPIVAYRPSHFMGWSLVWGQEVTNPSSQGGTK